MTEDDWQKIQAKRFSTVAPPANWPQKLRPVSLDGLSLFGMDPLKPGELFWDGEKLITERRWSNAERLLAGLATASAVTIALIESVRFGHDAGQFMGWW